MRQALIVVLLSVSPVWAQPGPTLPTLYDVVGVGPGDGLNVRAEPNAGATIVGRLAPDARGIEVVELDTSGRWGQVNTGERAGWVAMRYLAEHAGVWRAGSLPGGLACFGTEPFWSLTPAEDGVAFSTPDAQDQALALVAALDTGTEGDRRRALVAEGGGARLTATIAPGACNDGMSDRAYGLVATVVREGNGEPYLLTGCCSLGR